MVAYEFYRGDSERGYHLIGVLPERRSDPDRINNESIMNWLRALLGDQADQEDVYFIPVHLAEPATPGPVIGTIEFR